MPRHGSPDPRFDRQVHDPRRPGHLSKSAGAPAHSEGYARSWKRLLRDRRASPGRPRSRCKSKRRSGRNPLPLATPTERCREPQKTRAAAFRSPSIAPLEVSSARSTRRLALRVALCCTGCNIACGAFPRPVMRVGRVGRRPLAGAVRLPYGRCAAAGERAGSGIGGRRADP
jgi:hypothetical protein